MHVRHKSYEAVKQIKLARSYNLPRRKANSRFSNYPTSMYDNVSEVNQYPVKIVVVMANLAPNEKSAIIQNY